MATKFQIKRTSVSGRTPNTTNVSNTSYIAAGELALNLTDGKLYSSNGTAYFEVGANLTSLAVTTLSANGSYGSPGQVLASGGSGANLFWTTVTATPGGSNTQIQFNDSGALGGDAAFTFDKLTYTLTVSNTIVVGNTTVNLVANSTSLLIGTTTVNTTTVAVGANVTANTTALKVGNSTVNTVITATGITTNSITVTANVVMGGNYVTNLGAPLNANDAATKAYVDSVAEGLHTHDTCNAATTDTLATLSSGTVTYDNGTAGVGAKLTTTGSYTTIDGVTLSDGSRILVKNEANAAHNGIYERSNTTVLIRATDFDTPAEMAGGDFTFVTGGTSYDSTGWVLVDPVTTVGTTNANWAQFSGAGTYQAGSYLFLNGTIFSANANTQAEASVLVARDSNAGIAANNITAAGNVYVGNSTVFWTANSTEIDVGSVTINTSALLVGNSTVNSVLSSTSLNVGGTANAVGNIATAGYFIPRTLGGLYGNVYITAANNAAGNSWLRIQTQSGYIDIGSYNTGFAHFQTDRNRFYFDKEIQVNGLIKSYQANNYLSDSGLVVSNGNITVGNSTVNATIATTGVATFGNTTINGTANVSGNVTFSTNTALFDTTNSRVTIGLSTDAPQSVLAVGKTGPTLSDSSVFSAYHLNLFANTIASGEGSGIGFTVYNTESPGSQPTGTPGAAIVHERVGVNSQGKLHFKVKTVTTIGGALTKAITINESAKVGIGNTAPTHQLRVEGDASIATTLAAGNTTVTGFTDVIGVSNSDGLTVYRAGGGSQYIKLNSNAGGHQIIFNSSNTNTKSALFQLNTGGSTGIDNQYRFTIDGAEELKINSTAVAISADLIVSGNVFFNGTTTNVNSTNLVVEDKNIIVGDVATPTDVTADGGGITLKGTTDKTLNWVDATDAWTSSEDFNLVTGKSYEINGTVVVNSTSLGTGITGSSLTSVGTLTGLTVSGATDIQNTLAAGNTTIYGKLLVGNSTVNGDIILSGTQFVSNAGRIGIGTSTPAGILHIISNTSTGTASFTEHHADLILEAGTAGNARLFLKTSSNNANWEFFADDNDGGFGVYEGNTGFRAMAIIKNTGEVRFSQGTAYPNNVVFAANGNVGIGTLNPAAKLRVEGNASISTTLDAGNTTVTGFVNASVSVNSALITVGTSFIANTSLTRTPPTLIVSGGGATSEGAQIVLGYGNNLATAPTTQANNTWNIDVVGGNTGSTPLFRVFAQNGDATIVSGFNIANTGRMHVGSLNEQTDSTFKVTGSANVTTSLTVGTTLAAGNTTITGFANVSGNVYVGNSTVFWTANSTEIDVGNVTINTTAIAVGANIVANTTVLRLGNTTVGYAISANGSLGTNGQILTSNGSSVYWSSVVLSTDTFTGNGSNTQFTLSQSSNALATFVFINGVAQRPTADYSISGTTLTFTFTPALNNIIEVRSLGPTSTISIVDAATVGGNTAATLRAYSDTMAAAAYTNAITYSANATNLTSGTISNSLLPANMVVNTTLTVGNSTVNVVANSTTITLGANVSVNTSAINIGNSSVNTQITAGNIALNGSQLSIGNSTVNTIATGDTITLGNVAANTTVLRVGANAIINTTALFVGNSTVNTTISATSVDTDGTLIVAGAATVSNTLAAGNTTITGFANITSTLQVGTAAYVIANGHVGIATATPGYTLEVNGSFAATTKSFVIDHPTKPGMKLRYGSLEGPENGVYARGKLDGENVIELPEYWTKLVDENTITVQLTSIGKHQKLFVEEISDNKVYISNGTKQPVQCFFVVFAERKDVNKLVVEY